MELTPIFFFTISLLCSTVLSVPTLTAQYNDTHIAVNTTKMSPFQLRGGRDFELFPPPGYGVTFFHDPDCKNPTNAGPHINFGCSQLCWPVGSAMSVLIEAKKYDQRPIRVMGKLTYIHKDRSYLRVAENGPVVQAFSDSQCSKASFIAPTIRVTPTRHSKCHTFAQPVFGAGLKLLRDCRNPRQNLKDKGAYKHYDWYNSANPESPFNAADERQAWRDYRNNPTKSPEETLTHVAFPDPKKRPPPFPPPIDENLLEIPHSFGANGDKDGRRRPNNPGMPS